MSFYKSFQSLRNDTGNIVSSNLKLRPNVNTTQFDGIFEATLVSAATDVPAGGIMAAGATSGQPDSIDPDAIHWLISSIIWKSGNKYGKPWIGEIHRLMAQISGYNFGFTFHGHYKAVSCETIIPTLEANGLLQEVAFHTELGYPVLKDGNFRKNWNAFSDLEDLSPQFVEGESVTACELGPCPETDGDDDDDKTGGDDDEDSAAAGTSSLLYQVSFLGFTLAVIGITDVL